MSVGLASYVGQGEVSSGAALYTIHFLHLLFRGVFDGRRISEEDERVWVSDGDENTERKKSKTMEKGFLLKRVVFISMGEYIKLVEREKEAHSECSTHQEAETDLGALRKLRNQPRVDNLNTKTIVGKVPLLSVY